MLTLPASSATGQQVLGLVTQPCLSEMRPGLPLQILPQPTLLPPTKALSDQSLCWVEWRQETVIPPRLGPTLHRAAHYQAETVQPRLLRSSYSSHFS